MVATTATAGTTSSHHHGTPDSSTHNYTIKPGDTLSKIARQHGVSVQELLAANPQIRNPDLIYAGDGLTIPDRANHHTAPGSQIADTQQGPARETRLADASSAARIRNGAPSNTAVGGTQYVSDPNASPEELLKDPRVRAMLDTLGYSEGTGNNYGRVVFGTVTSSRTDPSLVGKRNVVITDFSRHPDSTVHVSGSLYSTAAGRYQFLTSTWNGVAKKLGLKDFSPHSQDLAAIQLMKDRGMIAPLLKGDVRGAIIKGAPEWASLPNASGHSQYGQGAKSFADLQRVYGESLQRQTNGTAPPPSMGGGTVLGRGSSGSDVKALQDQLIRLGHMTAQQVATGPGTFGPQTEAAVKEFQRANGLKETGKYDAATQAAVANITKNIKRGDTGGQVEALQKRLVSLGYMTQAEMATGPGTFGPKTEAALKRFQADHKIQQTGALGPTTYAALQNASGTGGAGPVTGGNQSYKPYTVYSTGSGGARRVSDPSQLMPHHDYQTKVRDGQTLEVRDVVLDGANGGGQTRQPIPSPVSGRIEIVGNQPDGAGNWVRIRGDNGEIVNLFHMSRIDVKQGARVEYGQQIGLQGSTGHSTGPHVHIEAKHGTINRWVNDLLDGKFDGVRTR